MRMPHSLLAAHVGQRLKHVRGGQSQTDFATQLGLKQSQYSRYETGSRLAPDRVISKAAQARGLDPREVIWGNDSGDSVMPQNRDSEFIRALGELALLLDRQSLVDLYEFLQKKVSDVTRRKQKVAKQAKDALEILHRQIL